MLPLGLETTFIWKGNVRCLENMFNQRLRTRALKEYQDFMKQLKKQLSVLDEEWKCISDNLFIPK
ncbi:FAD-dependent thymidylate synthase [uncultured Clostridium sp.]|uniref:FAD-dependent thymidylate synthase n=1 Tax=Clostridium faecium TaxID=2762223 RepID=A0ABR8YP27_9CLOT|nr:FAD-dependent thymidylate synthase [Clostridium faecium]